MPWYCRGCGERRGGTVCKKWCREKYGDLGADRVPRLDGMVYINDDGTGIPRYELMKQRVCPVGYRPKTVQGPRPQGWNEALERIGERAAALIKGGLPEC